MNARWVFVLCLLILLPTIARRDLWSPDEPRHAEAARTTLITGDYLVPHLAGEIYLDKPAPPFWLMAASMKVFGAHDWAARIPFVVLAVLERDRFEKYRDRFPAGSRIAFHGVVGGHEDVAVVHVGPPDDARRPE